jgi:hypothetical protein
LTFFKREGSFRHEFHFKLFVVAQFSFIAALFPFACCRWLKLANLPSVTSLAVGALQERLPRLRIITTDLVSEVDGKPLDHIALV